MTITLFIPCFIDSLYPQVGMSVVKILERLGHRVECPDAIACCGQTAFNSGYWDEARAVARPVLEKLQNAEVVVILSGSCGAILKVFYARATVLVRMGKLDEARSAARRALELDPNSATANLLRQLGGQ